MKVALVLKFFLFCCSILNGYQAIASEAPYPEKNAELVVYGDHLDSEDFVINDPGKTEVFRKGQRVSPEEALNKTALLQPRKTSPTGLMTLIPPSATNAARSAIFVDGFPILDPMGAGIDLNALPMDFAESFQYSTPFYPKKAGLLFSGGSLNIKLPDSPEKGSFHTSLAHYGGFKASAFVPKNKRIFGVNTENSTGKIPYNHPNSNDLFESNKTPSSPAHRLSLMTKGENDIVVLNLNKRKNPGAVLKNPNTDKSQQKDLMALAGYKYKLKNWDTKIGGTYTHLDYSSLSNSTKSWNSSIGTYLSGKKNFSTAQGKGKIAIDHRLENFKSDAVKSKNRHIIGAAASNEKPLQNSGVFDSTVRIETLLTSDSNSVRSRLAGGFGYKSDQTKKFKTFAGINHTHRFPDFLTIYGGNFDGVKIEGNSNIPTEKQTSASFGIEIENETTELIAYPFYSYITDLHAYDLNLSKYTSKSEARLYGLVFDTTHNLKASKLRFSSVWTPHRKDENGITIPFKPEWAIGTSFEKSLIKHTNLTINHNYRGVRTVSNGPDLKAYNQFSLRIDQKISNDMHSYLKIDNLLNEGAENFPGYPIAGRILYIGAEFDI